MLIGIDASRATKSQQTGTEYYSHEIIKHIAKLDHHNEYILYSPIEPNNGLANMPNNFRWRIMPFPRFWSQLRLSWELMTNRRKPTVVFEPAHTVPLIHPVPMVVTIHDLGFKHFPELYTSFERWYHNFSVHFSAKHAAHIITVSEYSKQDIVDKLNVKPEKISVIYHGYDGELFNSKLKTQNSTLPYNVEKPYILYIGRLEEKKNIVNALKAFRILKEKTNLPHQLVLGGKPGYGYERIQHTLKSMPEKIRQDVILPGYVPLDTYAMLLKHADLFFFPSNFEGFGIPVIEAMACGTPIACSDATSLPEVAGDAAMLFDPKKPEEIAKVLENILTSPKLQKELHDKGLKRARQFSWEKAARETLDVILKIGGRSVISNK